MVGLPGAVAGVLCLLIKFARFLGSIYSLQRKRSMQSSLKRILKLTAALTVVMLLCEPTALQAQTVDWIRQLGTSSDEGSYGVSADSLGNVYISGYTEGSLDGTNAGDNDAFIAKYTNDGSLVWTRQLGTSGRDLSLGVSADGLGNVYISGFTAGNLDGANAGNGDVFIAKYTSDGSLDWTKQLGTSSREGGRGVSADGLGNVYISGFTEGDLGGINAGIGDAFIAKYISDGSLAWTRQLGTSAFDLGYGVSADGLGNIYISGSTRGSLDGTNAGSGGGFIAKYTSDGSLAWTKQQGTSSSDVSTGVSADGLGDVYVSGTTDGYFNGGEAFIARYTSDGTLVWTERLGSGKFASSNGVSTDGLGNVYISGWSSKGLDGSAAGGGFAAKYTSEGALLWTKQPRIGQATHYDVSTDGFGNVYFSGSIYGNLDGTNAGGEDVFIMKIIDESFIGPSADFNADGDVDGDDLAIWEINYGNNGVADTDGDNDSDGADFLAWQRQYATSPGGASVLGSAVPEPATAGLLALAVLSFTAVRCRR